MRTTPTVDTALARQIARELALPIVEELLEPLADLVAARLNGEMRSDGQSFTRTASATLKGAGSAPDAQSASTPRIVDAMTLAATLGVSRDCIYDHAAQLGGRRLGDGPRGRLRFNLDEALAAWTTHTVGSKQPAEPVAAVEHRARRRRPLASDGLLPIKHAPVPRREAT